MRLSTRNVALMLPVPQVSEPVVGDPTTFSPQTLLMLLHGATSTAALPISIGGPR